MLRATPNTRALRRGSLKVEHSWIGKHQVPCYGFMGNVRPVIFQWFALADSFAAGSGKSILRYVTLLLVLVV